MKLIQKAKTDTNKQKKPWCKPTPLAWMISTRAKTSSKLKNLNPVCCFILDDMTMIKNITKLLVFALQLYQLHFFQDKNKFKLKKALTNSRITKLVLLKHTSLETIMWLVFELVFQQDNISILKLWCKNMLLTYIDFSSNCSNKYKVVYLFIEFANLPRPIT